MPASRRRRRPATTRAEGAWASAGSAEAAEIWFNPSCSKCRIAASALEEAGAEIVVRRYLDVPPTPGELAAVCERLGLEPWDITRFGEPVAASLGLAELPRERAMWLELLAAHPVLIQRPIVLTPDGAAWVARDSESVAAAVSSATVSSAIAGSDGPRASEG
jgi:arsenate reductase